jgi:hypothetical protein
MIRGSQPPLLGPLCSRGYHIALKIQNSNFLVPSSIILEILCLSVFEIVF